MESPSVFASMMRRLLDESGVFTRAEWAEFLQISTPAISQWTKDKTLPSAEHLRKVLWVVRTCDAPPAGLLLEFQEIVKRPAVELTPRFKSLSGRTIAEYILAPLINSFLHDLKRLDPQDQERFLLEITEMCTEESRRDSVSTHRAPEYTLFRAGSSSF